MTIERIIRIMAGFFVLLSLALGIPESPVFVSKWFLAFTAFVGLNLLQSGFTGFCPPEKLLAKMGFKRGDGAAAVADDPARGAWRQAPPIRKHLLSRTAFPQRSRTA